MLNHYRRLLAFRHMHPALVKGTLEFVETGDAVLSMIRRFEGEAILCAFNLSDEIQVIERPQGELGPLDGHGFSGLLRPDTIEISPYDAFFARLG